MSHGARSQSNAKFSLACVAGVQRGGKGEVECEREARSLGARTSAQRSRFALAFNSRRASRSHSTSPLTPICTPATQAKFSRVSLFVYFGLDCDFRHALIG